MLERIREGSQGVWAMVILGLVILSFVFAGIGGYISSSTDAPAAEVNGDTISKATLERAYENERARMESQYGEAFVAMLSDAAYLRDFRQNILNRLIGEKLIDQAAADMGLRVSDVQLKDAIRNMQEFQVGGQFNNDRYQALLRQAGYQPNTFRDYMRTQMTRQQLTAAMFGSAFSLPVEAEQIFALQQQTRDARYAVVPSAQFEAGVALSDEDINTYYQANLAQYDTEEQVKVAYVTLDAKDLEADIAPTEEELQAYYQRTISEYRTPEERRASHILIEFGDDQDAAKAKADALLVQLNEGADFAELAAAESTDAFSAENGGDLDWFGRGIMDPAFEDAAFGLANVGDMSGVVESEFGYHIILLTDVKPEQTEAFENVREDLVVKLTEEQALDKFYEVQERMAQLAFEVPDTLVDMESELGLTVQQTELFTRNTAPAPLDSPQALATAFSADTIDSGMNTDLVEFGEHQVMVMRVVEHEPARTQSLDEVKQDIVAALTQQKAQQAAKDWAMSVLADVVAGTDVTATLAEKDAAWEEKAAVQRFDATLARNIIDKLFALAPEGEDKAGVVSLDNGDVALVELTGVNHGEAAEPAALASIQERMATNAGQQQYAALIEALRSEADIKLFQ
ncbi:SurA N-terminal domain-containing protein [Aestuariibacter halophilus]|uniref:Periplasmic chaperone PpiD n=1 Tax=Fluctibacter halophilus TaxID=226011 RepID=A0ABS8G226_9ALTE|nr:SurA N-terminal domain-containing protein [Aestuariibacter halophilus]MCC2614630.1 SurA N-terminal domain-containing protein [Aestuariibacter halophilus]